MAKTLYDPSNVFARILRGELPAFKVYEDADALAIMDVMPSVPGHCLVIPKAPSRNLLDADPVVLARVIAVVQKVAAAAKAAFEADGVVVQQFNESAAGQTVFHLHFHIMPRQEGVPAGPHGGKMAEKALLEAHAARIRSALAAG